MTTVDLIRNRETISNISNQPKFSNVDFEIGDVEIPARTGHSKGIVVEVETNVSGNFELLMKLQGSAFHFVTTGGDSQTLIQKFKATEGLEVDLYAVVFELGCEDSISDRERFTIKVIGPDGKHSNESGPFRLAVNI